MLTFGKYKGKSFEEVAAADAGYCRWVLNLDTATGAMVDFQGFLKAKAGGGGGSAASSLPGAAGPLGAAGADAHLAAQHPPAGVAQAPAAAFPGPAPTPAWLGAATHGAAQLPPWTTVAPVVTALGPQAPVASAAGSPPMPAWTAPAAENPLQTPSWSSAAVPGAMQGQHHMASVQHHAVQTNRGSQDNVALQGTVFVLELVSVERFALHAERLDPDLNSPTGLSAFLPRPVWQEICAWPGQELDTEKKRWTFPLASHGEVLARLASRGWPAEPIPDFALRATRPKAAQTAASVEMPSVLMPYQRAGVLFGLNQANGRVLIGDEMGLGKTLQALVLISMYKEDWPALVICPSSLRFVWREQAEKWLPELCGGDRVQVITKGKTDLQRDAALWVISYNLLADSRTGAKFLVRPGGEPHRIVVCDESHNIKEWKAQRTKAVVQVLQGASRAILLSGTPTRNTPDELHPQLCGLQVPGLPQYQAFRRRYCVERQTRVGGGSVIRRVHGARNSTELNLVLTSSVMIRRLKKDVLHELPEKRRQKVPIEPSDTKVIKDIRAAMANVAEGSEAICTLFKKLAAAKLPDVREYILDVLDRGDEKFIVFAHHHEMLDGVEAALQKRLAQENLSYVRIDGRTAPEKRLGLVNQFQEQERCRVALLSITACCEGLTLTAAGLVIFAELYWVPGTVEQAEARAHRIGTKHTKVVVEFLVVTGSPDEMVFNQLERKKRDTSSVLDGEARSLGVENCPLRTFKRAAESAPEDCTTSPKAKSFALDRFFKKQHLEGPAATLPEARGPS